MKLHQTGSGGCSFFIMDSLKDSCLSTQDTLHLLTRSNLIVIGREVVCCFHLAHVVETIAKSKHALAIDNKNKQNDGSITLLGDKKVERWLKDL